MIAKSPLTLLTSFISLTLIIFLFSACTFGPYPNTTPVRWSLPVGGSGYSIIIGDTIYGFTSDNRLRAVDLETKEVVWETEAIWARFELERPILTTDSKLLYGDTGSNLNVYQLDGTLLSSTPHPGGSDGNKRGVGLILKEKRLFIPNGTSLYVYDVANPNSPELIWQTQTRRLVSGLDVDADGDVYLSHNSEAYETNLYKLDGDSGDLIWEDNTSDERMIKIGDAESLQIVEGKLMVDALYHVLAYNLKTGEKLWVSDGLVCGEAEWEFADGLVFANNALYRNCAGGAAVLAIDATSGGSLWMFDANINSVGDGTFGGRPVYHNGVLYASNGHLWAFDSDTGNVLSFTPEWNYALYTHLHIYKGDVVTWGGNLTVYKAVR